MVRRYFKYAIFLYCSLLSLQAFAALQHWKIIPAESRLSFIGTQNGAPAGGYFTSFSGDIQLDRNNVNTGYVKITVDMRSIAMTYADFTETLTASDWFNVGIYPDAVFQATQFQQVGKIQYQAKGTLTIRDRTLPMSLAFTAKNLSANKMRVTGKFIIRRSLFGIGQNTQTIQDKVIVNFVITAVAF